MFALHSSPAPLFVILYSSGVWFQPNENFLNPFTYSVPCTPESKRIFTLYGTISDAISLKKLLNCSVIIINLYDDIYIYVLDTRFLLELQKSRTVGS